MIKAFYSVRKGRTNGVVVKTWSECEALVKGYPGAIYKGFSLYNKSEADAFAKGGDYGKHTPNQKPKVSNKAKLHHTPQWPCLLRKTYKDPFTGVLYTNRCVMRQGRIVTGSAYKPHIGNSCPF